MSRHEGEPETDIEHVGHARTGERASKSDGLAALAGHHGGMTLRLQEEELLAEKRLVQIGVVRIRRQVIMETRTIEVVVAREEMIIERLPIAAGETHDPEAEAAATPQVEPALAERLRALQLGETLRLPIVEEEVIIQKRPMVTQELLIDKRLVEEVRRLSDTVRREDVRVTRLGVGHLEVADEAGVGRDMTGQTTSDSVTAPLEEQSPAARVSHTQRTIELREEELLVRKQVVEAGTVEVHTGVVAEQQSVVVRAEHEETAVKQVAVEPRPADHPVGSGDDIFDIPEYGEQVILRKRPVVTEEIVVDKEVVHDVQQVRATVRREEAQIEIAGGIRLDEREESKGELG